jgi:hypothetical protein
MKLSVSYKDELGKQMMDEIFDGSLTGKPGLTDNCFFSMVVSCKIKSVNCLQPEIISGTELQLTVFEIIEACWFQSLEEKSFR